MKTIVAVVTSGLGNRLMGLMSCIHIAERENAEVLIVWPEFQDCNIHISKLFDIKGQLISILDEKTAKDIKVGPLYRMAGANTKIDISQKAIIPGFPELNNKIESIKYFEGTSEEPLITRKIINENNIFLWPFHFIATEYCTRQDMAKGVQSIFWRLMPSREVLRRVEEFEKENSHVKEYLSLHVRRPYFHRKTPEQELIHSADLISDEDYLKIAELIINKYEKNLFLCSNDPEIEKKAQERFGNSILLFNKNSTMNNNPLAIIDALAEMIIISRSIHAFASSSFSTFGMNIGDNPLGYTWIGTANDFAKATTELE